MLLFLACLAVFGHDVTANLIYPTVELAKRAEITGGLLERIESIYFVIWSMAIFNTASMSFDVSVLALHSLFKKAKKINIIFILTPLILYISLLFNTFEQVSNFGSILFYCAAIFTTSVTVLLFILSTKKGVEQYE